MVIFFYIIYRNVRVKEARTTEVPSVANTTTSNTEGDSFNGKNTYFVCCFIILTKQNYN